MTQDLQEGWLECCRIIRDNIGEKSFEAFFSRTRALSLDADKITLEVPSQFFVDRYEAKYVNLLHKTFKRVFGRPLQIFYSLQLLKGDKDSQVMMAQTHQSNVIIDPLSRVGEAPVAGSAGAAATGASKFDSQLNSKYNFETYCTGQSNILAVTIAQNIAQQPHNNDFNPFFLYGDVGIGKTHLIQAIGIRVKEKMPNAKVLYTTSRQFQHLYTQAVIKKTVPQFINWFMQMDVLLFDDLQEIAGMVKTTEQLFPIFNHLHMHGKQLVFTCDRPPMELDGIADRLIDRFKYGLTERLPKPDVELRKKILRAKSLQNGLGLPEDVIDYVASNAVNSIREIEGVVRGILMRSITLNAPVTVQLAREVMGNTIKIAEKKPVNFEMIVEATADFFNLNPDALFSKNRMRDINDARQVLMYLSHKLTGLSSTVIGRKLNRQHGTVLHGIAAVKDRIATVPEFAQSIERLEASL